MSEENEMSPELREYIRHMAEKARKTNDDPAAKRLKEDVTQTIEEGKKN